VRSSRFNIFSLLSALNTSEPLNITQAIQAFYFAATAVTGFIDPVIGVGQNSYPSIILPSLGRNYSSIVIHYPGRSNELIPQSSWSLDFSFYEINNSTEGTYTVRFFANGTLDNTSDVASATKLLQPTFQLIQAAGHGARIDFWEVINWYFVSLYWTFLYQFGDISPTIYSQINVPNLSVNGTIGINGMGYPNFSDPITFPPTNNIFWNETLFEIYSHYLRTILAPLFPTFNPDFSLDLPPFLPLNDSNRIQRSPTTIFTSYQCNQLQLKGRASATISILVAIGSLWMSGFAILLLLLQLLEK